MILFLGLAFGIALSSAHPSGQRGPTLSDDLKKALARGERVRVIVQAEEDALLGVKLRHGRGLRRALAGALTLDLSSQELNTLKHDSGIAHISGDLPVVADVSIVNKVTSAESVWSGTKTLLGLVSTPGYTGEGIGVAVIDSGIADHSAVSGRVVARVNLVSNEPGVTGDPFGHGTHIAGLIGGNTTSATYVTNNFTGGSAPKVHFADVRVLGSTGAGYTSDVIAGLDWTVANARKYNLRIANISLGHPVAEPSAIDPLCRAVERAVRSGIVVVVSAGNQGRTAQGAPVMGGITSPGNSPFAITVGALDMNNTVDRGDDRVAAYSSRGPTKYDFAVKPDLVAPGSNLVSLESPRSWLATRFPAWHVAGSGKNAYFRLSGTSMSAAVVSGGVALLLDSDPGLSPAQVKLALQTGSRFMRNDGLIAAGAGAVDFQQAQKLAHGGLLGSLVNTLTSTLGLTGGASFRDSGTLIDRVYDRTGVRLLSILDLSALFGSANDAEWGVLNLLGLSNPIGSMAPNYVVWGSAAGWSNSYYVVWGSSMQSPDGEYVVWGSGDYDGEYVVWGSSVVDPDSGK
ncbi:MAG TPA: S8 family peptidase [Vicinamibacterales bacterium]|jgi:serine protease AprX